MASDNPGRQELSDRLDDVLDGLKKRDEAWRQVEEKMEELIMAMPRAFRKRYWMGFVMGGFVVWTALSIWRFYGVG